MGELTARHGIKRVDIPEDGLLCPNCLSGDLEDRFSFGSGPDQPDDFLVPFDQRDPPFKCLSCGFEGPKTLFNFSDWRDIGIPVDPHDDQPVAFVIVVDGKRGTIRLDRVVAGETEEMYEHEAPDPRHLQVLLNGLVKEFKRAQVGDA